MWNLYKYRVKRLFMDKSLFFWLLIFPIILGSFFWMSFKDITAKSEGVETIGIAIVDDGTYENDEAFDMFVDNFSGKDGIFDVKTRDEKKAIELLKEEKITGIIYVTDNISLKVLENGTNTNILEQMIDTYLQNEKVVMNVIEKSPDKAQEVFDVVSDGKYSLITLKEKDVTPGNTDAFVQYYFALFAMTCLFGSSYGIKNTKEIQIDQSDVAYRRNVAPTSKIQSVISDLLAALTIQMVIFIVVFVYLRGILGIDLGNKYGLILLSGITSSLLGISLGYTMGTVVKNQSVKENLWAGVSLTMCFLSGLMVADVKCLIENNAPIINRINPAAVISDSFYAICVFDDIKMYTRCLITMVVMIVILAVISATVLRKNKMD